MLIFRFIIAIYFLRFYVFIGLFNAKILINVPGREIFRAYKISKVVVLSNQPTFVFRQRTSEFKHLAHAVLKLTNM